MYLLTVNPKLYSLLIQLMFRRGSRDCVQWPREQR